MNRDEYLRMYHHENDHWWYVGMRTIASTLLDEVLANPSGRRPPNGTLAILDAGCGTGAGLEWLRRYGRATGIDLSEDALRFSRQRGVPRLVQGSVERLPFADGCFDLVTSFDVLYHLWVADASVAVNEVFRVLKPGGIFLLRVPALSWLRGRHDDAVQTRHRFSLAEVVRLLSESGFVVERATYANTLLLPMVAAKRLAERRAQVAPADLDATPAWLNQILTNVLSVEARMVRHSRLPIGVSVMAVARRPFVP
jgi:SAM-dependent methyltransferase